MEKKIGQSYEFKNGITAHDLAKLLKIFPDFKVFLEDEIPLKSVFIMREYSENGNMMNAKLILTDKAMDEI